MNYYNEFDPYAAQWLRELIADRLIPPGDVDERSICDVGHEDLKGYMQCHFFAGIGGWSRALELAGWPVDRPVWTASCPCQPFSAAGKRKGKDDERHLWPVFFKLVKSCRPDAIVGEQVAAAIRLGWLDGVCADLESAGYAFRSIVVGAHSLNLPHIRQRLCWAAKRLDNASIARCSKQGEWSKLRVERMRQCGSEQGCGVDGLDDDKGEGPSGVVAEHESIKCERTWIGSDGVNGWLGYTERNGLRERRRTTADMPYEPGGRSISNWSDFRLILCRDDKTRRVPTQPAFQPLADGLSERVVYRRDTGERESERLQEARTIRLKGYGNAIVPPLAAEFVREAFEMND